MMKNNAFRLLPYGLIPLLSASAAHAQDLKPSEAPHASPAQAAAAARRPAEMPPNPPRVSCAGDRLAVAAENSTLGSVLSAIHGCIGVEIDTPAAVADERTYFQLGPGPTRAILEALLSSTTEFDYAIQSSGSDPDKIVSILLIPHLKESGEGQADKVTLAAANHAMTPARRAWLDSRQVAARSVAGKADEDLAPGGEDPAPALGATVDTASGQGVSDSAVKEVDAGASKDNRKESAGATGPTTGSVAELSDAPKTNAEAQPQPETAPSPDVTQEPRGDKEFQKKITDMQQLFEERKKMLASPSSPPPSQDGPS